MEFDTVILGAGAAGLFAAARTKGRTLLIDHARAPGEKIRISGGGRCNFTNLDAEPQAYLSQNPHFMKSALARYTQWDFIAQMDRNGIAWHEKARGQLFCDESAKHVVEMLVRDVKDAGAALWLSTRLAEYRHDGQVFRLTLERDGKTIHVAAHALVVATGGKSIPKMGATGLAYDIARHFGLTVTETRAGLVPFTFEKGRFADMSGLSLPVCLSNARARFDEDLLFTHRGLSGPAVLQLSSYWHEGEPVSVDLLPGGRAMDQLKAMRAAAGSKQISTCLSEALPTRLVGHLAQFLPLTARLADQSDASLAKLAASLSDWRLTPSGTEGYRTAEVTLGGVDTSDLSSRTLEARTVPGLYFIGEAVDVTGWLGGYNFQWAWSSAYAAATAIAARF